MKKKKIKGLLLNKKIVSNLHSISGAANISARRTNCDLCVPPPKDPESDKRTSLCSGSVNTNDCDCPSTSLYC